MSEIRSKEPRDLEANEVPVIQALGMMSMLSSVPVEFKGANLPESNDELCRLIYRYYSVHSEANSLFELGWERAVERRQPMLTLEAEAEAEEADKVLGRKGMIWHYMYGYRCGQIATYSKPMWSTPYSRDLSDPLYDDMESSSREQNQQDLQEGPEMSTEATDEATDEATGELTTVNSDSQGEPQQSPNPDDPDSPIEYYVLDVPAIRALLTMGVAPNGAYFDVARSEYLDRVDCDEVALRVRLYDYYEANAMAKALFEVGWERGVNRQELHLVEADEVNEGEEIDDEGEARFYYLHGYTAGQLATYRDPQSIPWETPWAPSSDDDFFDEVN